MYVKHRSENVAITF